MWLKQDGSQRQLRLFRGDFFWIREGRVQALIFERVMGQPGGQFRNGQRLDFGDRLMQIDR
ncbi:hypothetical protein DN604_02890 [Aeromonas caviae]|nr:hypothetical protein DN604_02890 [Aeromonas caviae]